jgi:putative flippase GtrA
LLLFIAIKFIPSLIVAKFICDVILFVMGYWVTSKFVFFKKDNAVGNHSS